MPYTEGRLVQFDPAALEAEDVEARSNMPPHLAVLSEGQWALWRTVGLRGAGFPAIEVLKLSAPECAELADEIVDAKNNVDRGYKESLNAVNASLEALTGEDYKMKCKPLVNALRQLKKGKVPKHHIPGYSVAEAIENLRVAVARLTSLTALFRQTYNNAMARASLVIYEVLRQDRFREAIIWQNRHAWNNGTSSLLRSPPEANSPSSKRRRQHEEFVASYLQRYCVKNETIGFFGPVGWARITSEGPTITVRPGTSFLASRSVHFEAWGIEVLAEIAARNKLLKPWLAPRSMPFYHLDGTALHLPGGGSLELSAKQAEVLRSCDGNRKAKEIAADLLQASSLRFNDEEEVYSILEYLNRVKIIRWTLEIPLRRDSELIYRKLIQNIGDENLRKPVLEALAELEAARNTVAHAAGDPDKLNCALDDLEQKFVRLTHVAPTRAAGQTYAARTLVYEDCRRDIDVNVGPDFLRNLKQPLSLLLTSARWLTFKTAGFYRKALDEIYAEIVQETGSKKINAIDFWIKARAVFYKKKARIADRVVPIFQRRWAQVLRLPEGKRCVKYTSEELRPLIEAAFAAPRPGWSHARYHSPDIMLAASDAEAIRRGEYDLILGEIHIGRNTLNAGVFLAQHPCPQEVYKAIETDFPEQRIVPVPRKQPSNLTARTCVDFVPPDDYRLEIAAVTCGTNGGRALPIGSLVVENTDQGLMLRCRDGRIQFEIIEGLGALLSNLVVSFFRIFPKEGHTPRIVIDRLVICRETWHFLPQEISFAYERDGASRFLAARNWMYRFGLPRFVFVKSPVEKKPIYVDLNSPMYVNILAKLIRRTKESSFSNHRVTVVEMLPIHDQAWLIDGEENHYTSEFRMVTVDLAR